MNEKINIALNEISEKHIAQAAKKPHNKKLTFFGAIAAVLAVVLLLNSGIKMPITAKAVALAATPRIGQRPDIGDYPDRDAWRADLDLWEAERTERLNNVKNALSSGLSYYQNTNQAFLGNANGTNQVWSPVNGYISLAILAETTGGETRQEILNLLGVDSLETLREEVSSLWESVYRDNGKEICVLANSLWLDMDLNYNQDTMDALAEHHYASIYQGNLGSASTNNAIQTWLNNQTGKFLSNEIGSVQLPSDTLLALISTVYLQSQWIETAKFSSSQNTKEVFHSPSGDTVCTFMNKKLMMTYYYWGEDFGAISLGMKNGCRMWFILPDTDKTTEDVLSDPQYLQMITDPSSYDDTNGKYMKVNLSLPKFDVRSTNDLKAGLKDLGITKVFDLEEADFTPASDTDIIYVPRIQQTARVAIDEEGVTAASYIIIPGATSPAPPDEIIDFILDRPFLFAITNDNGIPVFTGVVNQP